jgi:hypothetical protein
VDDSIDLNPFRRRLLKHGTSADARVLEVDVPKYQSPGAFLTHKYVVEVQPTGEPPFQAELKDAFNVFWAPKRGDLLKVKFNPRSHKVAFDLEGDPRYDSSMQKPTGQWTPGEPRPPSIFGTGATGAGESPPAPSPGTTIAGATVFQGMPDANAIAAAIAAAQEAAAGAMSARPPEPAPQAAPDATGGGGTVARLKELAQLRDAGVITAEEFEAQKLRILESL